MDNDPRAPQSTGTDPLPGDPTAGRPLPVPEPLQDPLDWAILARLEDLEQERINFGLYETSTSGAEILRRCRERDGDSAPTPDALGASLRRLCVHQLILTVAPGRYRSRISEIFRLLKNLKRLWRADQAASAP